MNSLSEKLTIFNTELTIAKKNLDLLKNCIIFKNIKDKILDFEEKIEKNSVELSNMINQNNFDEKDDIQINKYEPITHNKNINVNISDNTSISQQVNDVLLSSDSYLIDDEEKDELKLTDKQKLMMSHYIVSRELDEIEVRKYKKRFNERNKKISAKSNKIKRTRRSSNKPLPKENYWRRFIRFYEKFFKK